MKRNRELSLLHERVGWLEMTNHEFLNGNFRRQRTTFAGGTTVEVDFDARTYSLHYPARGETATR